VPSTCILGSRGHPDEAVNPSPLLPVYGTGRDHWDTTTLGGRRWLSSRWWTGPVRTGTVSLVIEAALVVLGVTMLMAYRQRASHRLVVGRLDQLP
jgi:hypothetical protein